MYLSVPYTFGQIFAHLYSLWKDIIFDLMTLTLKFDLLLKNFNLDHNFLITSDRAFILHMCITYDKTFHMVPYFFYLMTLILMCDLLLKNCNLGFYCKTLFIRKDFIFA